MNPYIQNCSCERTNALHCSLTPTCKGWGCRFLGTPITETPTTEKEKANMYAIGAKDIIEKILPVVDSFERGLATVENPEEDPFADGMNKVYKQFTTALDELGVTVIEAVGKEFDPNLHNAVMHVEDEEAGENIVVEEFLKGYMYKGSVVRHSMVKVAN